MVKEDKKVPRCAHIFMFLNAMPCSSGFSMDLIKTYKITTEYEGTEEKKQVFIEKSANTNNCIFHEPWIQHPLVEPQSL